MKKKTKKALLIISLSFIAIIIILIGLKKLSSEKTQDNITYRTRQEKYADIIEISGTVDAAKKQTLQALSAGTVTNVYVKPGDTVKKGDVILQLDNTEQIYNLRKQEYAIAQKKITGSANEVKLMETEKRSLERKVQDRKIIANFDGIIADFTAAVGDSLDARSAVGTIVNVDYLTTDVEVTETDVAKLKVGQEVDFNFPACPGKKVIGYITGWPAIGEVTSRGATVVKVKIQIDDYPEQILPNYSFTGKIQISPEEEFVMVEKYAIGYDDNKKPYVEDATTGEKINVTIKPYGREYVKILSGVTGGVELKQLTEPSFSGYKSMGTSMSKTMSNPMSKSRTGGTK